MLDAAQTDVMMLIIIGCGVVVFAHWWPDALLMFVIGGAMVMSIVTLAFGIMTGRKRFF